MTTIHQTTPKRPTSKSINQHLLATGVSDEDSEIASLNSSSSNKNLESATLTYHNYTTASSPSQFLQPQTSQPQTRPLSRSSMTSCISTTATKDGIEGNRIHRKKKMIGGGGGGGITGGIYSLNLIQRMYELKQQQEDTQQNNSYNENGNESVSDSDVLLDHYYRDINGASSGNEYGTYKNDNIQSYDEFLCLKTFGGSDEEEDTQSFNSSTTANDISSMIPMYSKEDLVMSLHSLALPSAYPTGGVGTIAVDLREKTSSNASVRPSV